MKYNIITIEREYASGGSEIGKRLSEALGIPCYGQEILEIVAKNRGTTPEQIVHMEERSTGSFLYSIAMAARVAAGTESGLNDETNLYIEEAKIIRNLTDKGNCIVVGRCAGWILKDRRDVLNVYIHADKECRTERAVTVYHDDGRNVDSVLRGFDKRRANFYSANTGRKWDDKTGYHLVLDSGKLGIEKCVEIIRTACE